MKGMRAPRAPNEHFARGKGATTTSARAQRVAGFRQTPQNPRAGQDTKEQFSTDFRLPYSLPRIKRSQKEHKNKNRNYKLDPTDDKEGIQKHPVE